LNRRSKERVEDDLLLPSIGAVIFASDEPVPPAELARVLGDLAPEEIERSLDALRDALDGAGVGIRLERIAGGFRLTTRPEIAGWVRRFFRERNRTRLSPAGLETLAIIAYRQPVTAPEIQAIRGKDPSAALKSLLDKRMIRILGKKKVVGSPLLYGTSRQFLLHFGLDNLKDLPSLEEFEEFVGALDVQSELFEEGAEVTASVEEADGPPSEGETVAQPLPVDSGGDEVDRNG
jgi:segregation and condensation protein B